MSWRGWAKTPARKPVFVLTYVFAGGLALLHTCRGTDIPPGILSLVNNMLLIVSGMYGLTSASESIYGNSCSNNLLNVSGPPNYYSNNNDNDNDCQDTYAGE